MRYIYTIRMRAIIYYLDDNGNCKSRIEYTVNPDDCVYSTYDAAKARMYQIVNKKIKKHGYTAYGVHNILRNSNNLYIRKSVKGLMKYRIYKIVAIKVK